MARIGLQKMATFMGCILKENMGGNNMVTVLVCSDGFDVFKRTGTVIDLLSGRLLRRKFQIRNINFKDDNLYHHLSQHKLLGCIHSVFITSTTCFGLTSAIIRCSQVQKGKVTNLYIRALWIHRVI
jgi:hypothetical protein